MEKCPQCGGEVWDNVSSNNARAEIGEKLRPDYSCKDKDICGWIQWRPKDGATKQLVKQNMTKPKVNTLSSPATISHKMDDDFGYRCNALNNATVLMKEAMKMGANYEKEALALYYNDCLEILKG